MPRLRNAFAQALWLRDVAIRDCHIGNCFPLFVDGIATCPSLKVLTLDSVVRVDDKDLEKLSIKMESRLDELSLMNLGVDAKKCPSITRMLDSKASKLQKLNLSSNKLGPDGCKIIMQAIIPNTNLTFLDIGNNAVRKEGAASVGRMLEKNRNIRELRMTWNEIEDEGLDHILKGIQRNNTLRTIDIRWNGIGPDGVNKVKVTLRRAEANRLEVVHLASLIDKTAHEDNDELNGMLKKPTPKLLKVSQETNDILNGMLTIASPRGTNEYKTLLKQLRENEEEIQNLRDQLSKKEKEKELWIEEMAAQRSELQTLQHKLNSEQRLNMTKLEVATAKIKELQRQLTFSTEHLKGFDIETEGAGTNPLAESKDSSHRKDGDMKKLNELLREKLVSSEEDLYIAKQRAEALKKELEILKTSMSSEPLNSTDVNSKDEDDKVSKDVFMALKAENEMLRKKVQELHAKKKRLEYKLVKLGAALRSSTPTPKPGVRRSTQNSNGHEKKAFRPSTTFCIRDKNKM
eukprot:jgi/Bigna1/136602/aug1.34_g11310